AITTRHSLLQVAMHAPGSSMKNTAAVSQAQVAQLRAVLTEAQALQLPPSTSTGQGTQSVSVLTDLQLQQLSSIINRSPILQTLQQQPSQSLSTSEMGQLH